MTVTAGGTLSHCAEYVRKEDYGRYLATLFVPAGMREAHFTLLAFHAEIARIPAMVSEPVLGHIRFSWWREALEELYAGAPPRKHPVVQAFAPLIFSGVLSHPPLNALLDTHEQRLEGETAINTEAPLMALLSRVGNTNTGSKRLPKWQRAHHAFAEFRQEHAGHICRPERHKLKLLWRMAWA